MSEAGQSDTEDPRDSNSRITLPPPPALPTEQSPPSEEDQLAMIVRVMTDTHQEMGELRKIFFGWMDARSKKEDAHWSTMADAVRRIDARLEEGEQRFERIEQRMAERDEHDRHLLDRVSALALQPHNLSPDSPLRDLTVLVLEDDLTLREVMCGVCQAAGARAIGALDLESARAQLGVGIDVATVDILLGRIDGLPFVREVLASSPGTGILVVTGRISEQQAAETRALGVPVLEKPFTPNQLVGAILGARRKT